MHIIRRWKIRQSHSQRQRGDNMATIVLSGREYPLRFSMNLQEKISERYGDVSFVTSQVLRYSEARWLLTEAINEGYRFEHYFSGAPSRTVTEEEIGVITTFSDFSKGRIAQALLDALNDSLSDDADQKKISMEDLEALGSKLLQEAQEKSTSKD